MEYLLALLVYLSNPWIKGLVGGIGLALAIAGSIVLLLWVERKFIGRLQHRYGPNRVGKFGILQLVVDGIKLLTKEDIIPDAADKTVFKLAPIIAFAIAFLPFLAIPFSETMIVSDLNVGILFILAVSSMAVVPTIMAGWSPNNKYNLLGGMRAAALMISYEVPMGLAIIGVVMLTDSMSMVEIVKAQEKIWFIFPQALGFVVFVVAAFMEAARLPFDLPEAESEIVQGWTTEFSGMKFAMLLFAEYIHSILASLLIVILFLGGWHGPILPAPIWVLIKTFIVMLILMWMRATVPRVRIDQLLNVGWKVLIPLAMINIAFTGTARVILG
jgi:NADH-quinone oxidoreductase subunit H|tara:strand:+ start:611 stop:1597 length:987 start_codon:yes stop_codon:yes gene_type:complete